MLCDCAPAGSRANLNAGYLEALNQNSKEAGGQGGSLHYVAWEMQDGGMELSHQIHYQWTGLLRS